MLALSLLMNHERVWEYCFSFSVVCRRLSDAADPNLEPLVSGFTQRKLLYQRRTRALRHISIRKYTRLILTVLNLFHNLIRENSITCTYTANINRKLWWGWFWNCKHCKPSTDSIKSSWEYLVFPKVQFKSRSSP